MYRDGIGAIRDQVESLAASSRALIEALGVRDVAFERSLLARFLGPRRCAELATQIAECPLPSDDADAGAWMLARDRYAALVGRLEAVDDELRRFVERDAHVMPDEVRAFELTAPCSVERASRKVRVARACLGRVLAAPEDEAVYGEEQCAVRFRRSDVPFAARFDADVDVDELRSTFATSVPWSTLPLEVKTRPMGLMGAIFSKGAVSVGDSDFDALFDVCCADLSFAKAMLTAPVRRALRRLAHWDVPSLAIADGLVVVSFAIALDLPTDREVVHTALDAIAGVRSAVATRLSEEGS